MIESIKRHNSYEIEFLLIVQQEGNAYITIEQHIYIYVYKEYSKDVIRCTLRIRHTAHVLRKMNLNFRKHHKIVCIGNLTFIGRILLRTNDASARYILSQSCWSNSFLTQISTRSRIC